MVTHAAIIRRLRQGFRRSAIPREFGVPVALVYRVCAADVRRRSKAKITNHVSTCRRTAAPRGEKSWPEKERGNPPAAALANTPRFCSPRRGESPVGSFNSEVRSERP